MLTWFSCFVFSTLNVYMYTHMHICMLWYLYIRVYQPIDHHEPLPYSAATTTAASNWRANINKFISPNAFYGAQLMFYHILRILSDLKFFFAALPRNFNWNLCAIVSAGCGAHSINDSIYLFKLNNYLFKICLATYAY